ncbi:DUF6551 family protein [Steroidobacter sp.]|uniref:DUF6551 family protein n=1 Tax=Steroidobacter sp. TaxID=1978227 RepID=UPI001A4798F6|nr:DUF6551 family protein [Steroidobacter sp.]MBL8266026.1 ParB N-terminal domain-containing protein [Steroidobacter sp.]
MSHRNQSIRTHNDGTRAWKYDDSPMPTWLENLAGDLQPNGTFSLPTDAGLVRVHPGNIVVECGGNIWVRSSEDADALAESIELEMDSTIMTIGPGKMHQFGTKARRLAANDRRKYPSPVGTRPSIEWIHLNRLSVDAAYQRSTDNDASRRLISSITAKFDWRLCMPLVVSRRAEDELVIIDGQHRWLAACNRDDIDSLPCCLFRYKNMQEEARMFIVANRARKPISRLDDFYAAVAAGDEDALEIQQLVTDAGFRVARQVSQTALAPGEVVFTSGIASAIRKFGAKNTAAGLKHLSAVFSDQKLLHGGAILGALAMFLSNAGSEVDSDRLNRALRSKRIEEWGLVTTGVKSGGSRLAVLRTAIAAAYEQSREATADPRHS